MKAFLDSLQVNAEKYTTTHAAVIDKQQIIEDDFRELRSRTRYHLSRLPQTVTVSSPGSKVKVKPRTHPQPSRARTSVSTRERKAPETPRRTAPETLPPPTLITNHVEIVESRRPGRRYVAEREFVIPPCMTASFDLRSSHHFRDQMPSQQGSAKQKRCSTPLIVRKAYRIPRQLHIEEDEVVQVWDSFFCLLLHFVEAEFVDLGSRSRYSW